MKPDVKKRPRNWIEAQQELHLYLQQLGEMKGITASMKTEPITEKVRMYKSNNTEQPKEYTK